MEKNTVVRLVPLVLSLSVLALAGCKDQSKPQTAAPVPALASMTIPLCVNGECAVLDQNGAILVSADNDYDNVISAPFNNTFIFAKDGFWNLASADGKQIIKEHFTDALRLLTPGYYGVGQNDKFGVMDEQGKEIQPARFDDLYVAGENQLIVYEVDGKRGFLSATGQLITEPVFDSSVVQGDFNKTGGWMTAERGDEKWAINVNSHEQKKVEFDRISAFASEHMVVESSGKGNGLADAKGTLLTELKYFWMGVPSEGRVAFKEKYDSPCGYLDFQGKTVIQATFSSCEVFGKKGALVKTSAAEGETAKAGLIGRNGEWLIQPVYDSAEPAGYSTLGMILNVPGYTQIGKLQSAFSATFGIFDVNKGVELFKPTYSQIGVLNDDLFVFSNAGSPTKQVSMFGEPLQVPTLGVMDATGKVLIEPGEYVNIRLDASGQYLRAMEDTSVLSTFALYDLKGKRLVPAKWQELVIDEARGAIFGYELEGTGDDQSRTLKALYRLDGTPSFQISRLECGAEQVRDGKDQVLWPANPQDYCPQPEQATDAADEDSQEEVSEQG